MARCNCNNNNCNCFTMAGPGIDITGVGSEASPFVIGVEAPIVAAPTVIADHISDITDAHDASAISFVPTGAIAATNVQTAIAEAATDASTMLDAHLTDPIDAHDASAISVLDAGGLLVATTVEAALAELAATLSTQHVIGSHSMRLLSGTPAEGLVATNALPCWLMDAAATEIVGGIVRLPGWATYTVQLAWAPSTGAAGDTRWEFRTTTVAAGAVPTVSGATAIASTSPAVADRVVVTTATAAIALPAGSFHGIRISRMGADAADTYGADAKLIAVILNRAS